MLEIIAPSHAIEEVVLVGQPIPKCGVSCQQTIDNLINSYKDASSADIARAASNALSQGNLVSATDTCSDTGIEVYATACVNSGFVKAGKAHSKCVEEHENQPGTSTSGEFSVSNVITSIFGGISVTRPRGIDTISAVCNFDFTMGVTLTKAACDKKVADRKAMCGK